MYTDYTSINYQLFGSQPNTHPVCDYTFWSANLSWPTVSVPTSGQFLFVWCFPHNVSSVLELWEQCKKHALCLIPNNWVYSVIGYWWLVTYLWLSAQACCQAELLQSWLDNRHFMPALFSSSLIIGYWLLVNDPWLLLAYLHLSLLS